MMPLPTYCHVAMSSMEKSCHDTILPLKAWCQWRHGDKRKQFLSVSEKLKIAVYESDREKIEATYNRTTKELNFTFYTS